MNSAQTKATGDFAGQLAKAAEKAAVNSDDAKLKAACRDMEAVFLNLMLTRMRETVPKSSLMGNSSGEQIMRSMLDSEMTKNMAQAGGIGLADMLYRQLSLTAGVNQKSQAPR